MASVIPFEGPSYLKPRQLIGKGSFGMIYEALDTRTNTLVAIKVEPKQTQFPQLENEYKIYKCLVNAPFICTTGIDVASSSSSSSSKKKYLYVPIPQVYEFNNTYDNFTIMTMQLLGQDLEELLGIMNRVLQYDTIAVLAIQCISAIQYIHEKGFVHRDIKPDNFVIGSLSGKEKDRQRVFLIDYGLTQPFTQEESSSSSSSNNNNKNKNNHKPCQQKNISIVGTPRYASLNTHYGIEYSRRDDLISLGYVLVYLSKGKLPWQGQGKINRKMQTKKETKKNNHNNSGDEEDEEEEQEEQEQENKDERFYEYDKYYKIAQMKESIDITDLCAGTHPGLIPYLQICHDITFSQQPPYEKLKEIFSSSVNLNAHRSYEWDPIFKSMEGNYIPKAALFAGKNNNKNHVEHINLIV